MTRPLGFLNWLVPVLLAVASMILSGYVGYNHNDKALSNRITAIEIHEGDNDRHLGHVEQQVDKIYDKLLDWEKSR